MRTKRRSFLKSALAASVSLTLGVKMSMERVMGGPEPVGFAPPEPAVLAQAKLEEICRKFIAMGAARPISSPEGVPLFLFSDIDENGHSPTHDRLLKP